VIAYLQAAPEIQKFREHTFSLVHSAVSNFLERGFSFMSVGFGCTGGQHRSVFFSEQLGSYLQESFQGKVSPKILHYNLKRIGLIP
jgi:RNase adaptor protein for sRNA GlmZ degradation